MFDTGSLTFQEFIMSEALPLATIQEAVLEFLRGREDAVDLARRRSTRMCLSRA